MPLVYRNTFLHYSEETTVGHQRARSTERSWAPASWYAALEKPCSDATGSTAVSECGSAEAATTTVMLRNIANKARESDIRTFLDKRGFEGVYDEVVLPCDLRTRRNRGFCFVNFLTHGDFLRAMTELVGHQIEGTSSKKLTEVTVAAEQMTHQ
mmetsp:Transcript_1296/g.2838  ORF Transcript_1296/g.2838 Transcript_1296/m.2838 type:complete len:154 (+) Transcript_1296:48-509(+)